MNQSLQNRPHFYSDSGSSRYSGVAREYADLWKGHSPYIDHGIKVRTGLIKWFQSLQRKGVTLEDGALAICGPGFNVTNTDLSPEILDGMSDSHPVIIAADWSPDILRDAYESISSASQSIANKLRLTQRDFSRQLSAQFHTYISTQLEKINNVDDLRLFMKVVSNEVGLETIRDQKLIEVPDDTINPEVVTSLRIDNPFDFESILKGQTAVRFMTANMLVAGMLALTENDFRFILEAHKKNLSDEEYGDSLRIWHDLIREVNTEIASQFFIGSLQQNPKAFIYAPTDVNVHYRGADTHDRIDMNALRARVREAHYKIALGEQWTIDDSGETPPHSHLVQTLFVCANEEKIEPPEGE